MGENDNFAAKSHLSEKRKIIITKNNRHEETVIRIIALLLSAM